MAESSGSGMDRRQALLRLLGLAGLGAGTVAAGRWLSRRSERPSDELVVNAKRSHTVPASPDLPATSRNRRRRTGATGSPCASGNGRHQALHFSLRRRHRQAKHRLGSHSRTSRQHQSPGRCRTGPPMLGRRREKSYRHRRQLQRSSPLLPAFGHRRSRAPAKVPKFCFPSLPALNKLTSPAISCRTGPSFSLSSRPTRSSMSPSPSITASPASPSA